MMISIDMAGWAGAAWPVSTHRAGRWVWDAETFWCRTTDRPQSSSHRPPFLL